jgi:hypothetical protein
MKVKRPMRMIIIAAMLLVTQQFRYISVTEGKAQDSGSSQARLHERAQHYTISAPDFVDALASVAGRFKIPIGVAWVNDPKARTPVNLSLENATVEEVIATITKGQPGYAMEVQGGVVHVFSRAAISNQQNFLALRVETFAVHDEFVDVASRRLTTVVNQLVVPPKASSLGYEGEGVGHSLASTIEYPKVSVQLKNATVESILDEFAVASPRHIWVVTFSDDPKLTPTGFRRTCSLWTDAPVPDVDQPVWNLFHWGEALPRAVLGKN